MRKAGWGVARRRGTSGRAPASGGEFLLRSGLPASFREEEEEETAGQRSPQSPECYPRPLEHLKPNTGGGGLLIPCPAECRAPAVGKLAWLQGEKCLRGFLGCFLPQFRQ